MVTLVFCSCAGGLWSADSETWVSDTSEALLAGRGNGVAVSDDGRLLRLDGWQPMTQLEEPIVFAGAVDAKNTLYVGTGHPARLYRMRRGESELLAELEQEQVTALEVDAKGTLWVATVAPGVVSRWRRGALEEVGRLADGGIWDLAVFGGEVVVATGPPAALYRVTERGLERWVELPDTHARCLHAMADRVLVGTSGKGLILSVLESGQVALLADSPFTEIADITIAGDRSLWAAAVVGEPAATPPTPSADGEGSKASTEVASTDLDLPKVNGDTATSEILRLTPDGALLKVHRFTKQVAATVAWDGEGVLVGTGFEGEVWRFVNHGGARLATLDAVQVTAILGAGEFLLSQGPAQVLARAAAGEGEATYRIDAQKFPLPVHLGEFRIEPPQPGLAIRFRAGASQDPDDTWLAWSEWSSGASGKVPLPPAQVVQWELSLPAGLEGGVERVEVAYQQVNLPPRFDTLSVAEPGVVYLSGPPPSGPVVDASHPDFSGIFTVLDPQHKPSSPVQGKKYWRVGYRTVSWKVSDPNKDPLRFSLELERRDGFRLLVREGLEPSQLALDTTAVPDGWYRFLVTASDELKNPGAPCRVEQASEWFVVDNTPPEVALERVGDRWQLTVNDVLSPPARVEWSRDGDAWHGLAPADGVLDGRQESFAFDAAEGRHLLSVRVIDRHHNRTTIGAVED
jgi:sugar lactone lactonase YvrE